jgi:hypothetical protein
MSGFGMTACDECRPVLNDRKGSNPAVAVAAWHYRRSEWIPDIKPGAEFKKFRDTKKL